MTKREWKVEAYWYIIRAKDWLNSPNRREREYARYIKRFFFGDGEIVFDGNNDVWRMRKVNLELPMPTNIYMLQ